MYTYMYIYWSLRTLFSDDSKVGVDILLDPRYAIKLTTAVGTVC